MMIIKAYHSCHSGRPPLGPDARTFQIVRDTAVYPLKRKAITVIAHDPFLVRRLRVGSAGT